MAELLAHAAQYVVDFETAFSVTGAAIYTQFRRFGVQVDEQVTLPK